jgi:hypothetical protein
VSGDRYRGVFGLLATAWRISESLSFAKISNVLAGVFGLSATALRISSLLSFAKISGSSRIIVERNLKTGILTYFANLLHVFYTNFHLFHYNPPRAFLLFS